MNFLFWPFLWFGLPGDSQSLEIFNLDLQNSPQKIGVWWAAHLKFSVQEGDLKFFQSLGP